MTLVFAGCSSTARGWSRSDGDAMTVRVYDGAHGVNEMHRHNRAGEKDPAESFHAGTLGEGMRAAITAVRIGFKEMISAWRAT